jgi:hypothetical protein
MAMMYKEEVVVVTLAVAEIQYTHLKHLTVFPFSCLQSFDSSSLHIHLTSFALSVVATCASHLFLLRQHCSPQPEQDLSNVEARTTLSQLPMGLVGLLPAVFLLPLLRLYQFLASLARPLLRQAALSQRIPQSSQSLHARPMSRPFHRQLLQA